MVMSPRKARIRKRADDEAPHRERWIGRNSFFYEEDYRYMRFLIPQGLRILELGCGTGRLLAELKPSEGIGVDISQGMVEVARVLHPEYEFRVGDIEEIDFISSLAVAGPFDVIVLSDTLGSLDDCQAAISNLHCLCSPDTRIVIAYYSKLWEPLLSLARLVHLKMPQEEQNALSPTDIANFLSLSDFDVVKREWRQLLPRKCFGVGVLVNRFLAPFPLIRGACLRHYIVGRSLMAVREKNPSTTVIIPCRNERGNIENAVRSLPRFCENTEILFIEGHSKDDTLAEINRVIAAYPDLDIKVLVQDGKGKGDAVRKGFENARGSVLMILDADLTVPPGALGKFYKAITSGKGEFINGSRMVYPMEKDAMRFLNFLANHVFSWLFSWLLNQRFTDTLCGTKVLLKSHYVSIARNRNYFGDFDPFGDFDLIFGAAKLNLKVIEIPVAYSSRTYGETQISRFRHGWLLLRMVVFAFRKLKAF